MKKCITLSLLASSVVPCAMASSKTLSSWEGPYLGWHLGTRSFQGHKEASYLNDGSTPAEGWSSGEFHGDVYNTIASMTAEEAGFSVNPSVNSNSTLASFSPNIKEQRSDRFPLEVSGVVGYSLARNNRVYAAEARVAFGNFGEEKTRSLTHSGTKSGAFSDFEGSQVSFTNYGSVLTGSTSPQQDGTSAAYHATYVQNYYEKQSLKYHNQNALLGRYGKPMRGFLMYGLVGVVGAQVAGTTRAVITESSTGWIVANGLADAITASSTYTFSGEASRFKAGPMLGVGLEKPMKGHMSFRAEANYHHLGFLDVRATSAQTSATYTTRQKAESFNLLAGWVFER